MAPKCLPMEVEESSPGMGLAVWGVLIFAIGAGCGSLTRPGGFAEWGLLADVGGFATGGVLFLAVELPAGLFVKVLPVQHHCLQCGCDFDGSSADCPCTECGHPHTELKGGEELRLLDMEIDDSAA